MDDRSDLMTDREAEDTVTSQRLLITGACGNIGRILVPRLAATGRPLRLLDISDPRALAPTCGVDGDVEYVQGSVSVQDDLATALDGVGAVLHLAGASREGPWEKVLEANVHGTWLLLDGCRQAGVSKVVLASSHHVSGMTHRGDVGIEGLTTEEPARPDTYYGWSKSAVETLGRLFVDRAGLNVVAIRIGTFGPSPSNVRGLSTWWSPGDALRCIEAALDPAVLGWHCLWGISRNSRRWWSLVAGEAIGYYPLDDAESFAADLLVRADPQEVVDRAGGAFTTFPLGEDWRVGLISDTGTLT